MASVKRLVGVGGWGEGRWGYNDAVSHRGRSARICLRRHVGGWVRLLLPPLTCYGRSASWNAATLSSKASFFFICIFFFKSPLSSSHRFVLACLHCWVIFMSKIHICTVQEMDEHSYQQRQEGGGGSTSQSAARWSKCAVSMDNISFCLLEIIPTHSPVCPYRCALAPDMFFGRISRVPAVISARTVFVLIYLKPSVQHMECFCYWQTFANTTLKAKKAHFAKSLRKTMPPVVLLAFQTIRQLCILV